MKKAQVNYFIIVGLVAVIIVASFFVFQRTGKEDVLKSEAGDVSDADFQNAVDYFSECTKNSIVKANQEIGLSQDTKSDYETYVSGQIKNCMKPFLNELDEQGFEYTDAEIKAVAKIEENVLMLYVDYPVELRKNGKKFSLNSVENTFDRSSYVQLLEEREVSLVSPDNKAKIVVSPGTKITLEDGSTVDSIGLNVLEKNFDGLENSIVVGNLIYEALPDGAKFSKPVKISIQLRQKDLPADTTEGSVTLAWWDEELLIWRGMETTVDNGFVTAYVDHFTKFAIVLDCSADGNKIIYTPYLFKQKYSLIHPDIDPTLSIEAKAALESQYSKEDIEFCTGVPSIEDYETHKYWIEDFGAPFIPTLTEYLKYKNHEPNRIDKTVQELAGEKVTFGTGLHPTCEEEPVLVHPYRCCTYDEGCIIEEDRKGLQECMDLYGENLDLKATIDYALSPTDPLDYILTGTGRVGPVITVDRQIFGYNHWQCIGGKTEDGDGDGAILTISFDQTGGSCLNENVPIKVTVHNVISPDVPNPSNLGCAVSTNIGDFSSSGPAFVDIFGPAVSQYLRPTSVETTYGQLPGMEIIFKSAKVDSPDARPFSMCSSCYAQIELTGTGFSAAGYSECETTEESLLVGGECLKCEKLCDTPNEPSCDLIVAKGAGGDCTCTRQNEGKAWCDFDNDENTKDPMICIDGKLQPWTAENDPDYVNWVPEGKGCHTCTADRFGDNPCEKAVGE